MTVASQITTGVRGRGRQGSLVYNHGCGRSTIRYFSSIK
ncbi:hypothetical protein E2C01_070456 [Portunus trituberculatus]|uniref:Uncharacterized protein n=1 Tax=Portunus trituberculatus TaxID=210409 RepID=A0A5B7I1M2_PORTR|nr:hypothetical protein [Portunus trituberculatus]